MELSFEEIAHDSAEFKQFLENWGEEIEEIFPDFSEYDTIFANIILLRVDSKPAGIFIYQEKGDELHIEIDYLIPELRNQGIGKKFFENQIANFKSTGYAEIVALTYNQVHANYLMSVGFKQSKRHEGRFELSLD